MLGNGVGMWEAEFGLLPAAVEAASRTVDVEHKAHGGLGLKALCEFFHGVNPPNLRRHALAPSRKHASRGACADSRLTCGAVDGGGRVLVLAERCGYIKYVAGGDSPAGIHGSTHGRGSRRGCRWAAIEFERRHMVHAALALHQTALGGLPLHVSHRGARSVQKPGCAVS